MDGEDWDPATRRPSSNIMDYNYPQPEVEQTQHSTSPLARMASQSHNNRFHSSRHGKNPVRPRITTPSSSASHIPTMPIPIPTNPNVIPGNTLPSAPASPPTPAPSPTPQQRVPDWSTADPREEIGELDLNDDELLAQASATNSTRSYSSGYRHLRNEFANMDNPERERLLSELLNMCDGKTLGFVAQYVGPRLKRDPFTTLPNELCLRILTFIDDARTLARSSQVSKRWRELVSDDMAWKSLCERHAYRRMSDETPASPPRPILRPAEYHNPQHQHPYGYHGFLQQHSNSFVGLSSSAPDLTRRVSMSAVPSALPPTLAARGFSSKKGRRPKALSYRSHFKQRYQVETAWRHGGDVQTRQITPDQGVVTSLHLTPDYIIVALDNAKIHVFDTEGRHLRCLQGHVMGVWAMVPYQNTLVSGGCDRDVRVWDLTTGMAQHMLRGHTSTVRCLKMSGPNIAISGSRDTTLRVWDIRKGICKHVLVGHQASVRCLEVHGDLVVSGSYDTTARIWSISEGRCLRSLQGHFSQIYAVAFDGRRVATGSLDTSVRVWDARDGRCLAQLQGHTSLVGQLQLRNDTLVSGGSDGSVRVWSLQTYSAVHRLAAHDNSVTSLQFDDSRIVSGGSDGRVKVWDLHRGTLVRELGSPAEAVWRVVFEEEKAVVLASRNGKTVMEVWNFAPPPEIDDTSTLASTSTASSPGIQPYEDPTYGDRPLYDDLEEHPGFDTSSIQERERIRQEVHAANLEIERQQERERTKEMIQQQDEIMTDAYGRLGQQGGSQGQGHEHERDDEGGNDENVAPTTEELTE
ncbi:F-box/WD repeat-containing protein 7 [Fulvia fulva]|uniref:Mitochondrial division protein 1 n=1 Tax=Passalora fulva TaxID=5499 RepID=A0A9Q8P9U7_PASFU|nr:F-box/WD repeat-containing protein 7 [Fulvia fulva]KAK4623589.1 F-box/WD repeat-containing protein 7 [Fulvia fulva]KAK4625453.1 F-box/WD repeat-containing protein 7 [Fulvia fulva]UJO18376.1 F-box/WD repeat-containing protein 7 [Fulvia fulva]WPV15165.1 F-box/WD repeat-containing protein 7 [Fulvia fulva]WPV29985.1 F-box/WD repeat-containing protein 7 [Fulvia fulva]